MTSDLSWSHFPRLLSSEFAVVELVGWTGNVSVAAGCLADMGESDCLFSYGLWQSKEFRKLWKGCL